MLSGTQSFHSITNIGEESLVQAHEIQIIVIRYVGLRANPCDLLPEQSGEVFHLGLVQGKAIVHKYAYVSLLWWRFKNILSKMACAEVGGIVEDVPFVPTSTRQTLNIFDFAAIRNLLPTLPTSRLLFVGRYERATVNRCDGDVFPEHDFRTDLQEVELLVRD